MKSRVNLAKRFHEYDENRTEWVTRVSRTVLREGKGEIPLSDPISTHFRDDITVDKISADKKLLRENLQT